jgi:type I restriction-modification system DNA methylase subunit
LCGGSLTSSAIHSGAGHYQDVILPLTVLRRLDCVLSDTKERVLARQAELQGRGLQDLQAQLRRAADFAFYNTSRYDFDKLHADPPHLAANLRNYIAGFSQNMREVIERFDFDNTISKLDEAGLLFQVLERAYDHNPGFAHFIGESGLPFQPHAEFRKGDLDACQGLYRKLAEQIWNPERLAREAAS